MIRIQHEPIYHCRTEVLFECVLDEPPLPTLNGVVDNDADDKGCGYGYDLNRHLQPVALRIGQECGYEGEGGQYQNRDGRLPGRRA